MKNGKFGVGIIGCGVIATAHAPAVQGEDEAELVAVCDIDEPKGREFAQKYGCGKFYKDYNDMLKDPEVDIVCVCTPSGIHGECVIAAARAGRAILCEKPFEITRDKISRMIDEIEKARVKCACVFQLRTYAHKRIVHDAIRSGILGRLTLADAYLKDYRARSYYKSAGWRGTWALDGGGCLMNQGVHGVDQLLWLTGLVPESVFARADHLVRDIEVEDTCVASIQFTNGAFGTIVGAMAESPYSTICANSPPPERTPCSPISNITEYSGTYSIGTPCHRPGISTPHPAELRETYTVQRLGSIPSKESSP